MNVRPALPDDAEAVCIVVRASISELCEADHHNDPAMLDRWLANKTPQAVAQWIENRQNKLLVAVEGGQLLAAGCFTATGAITLNYVAPAARFRGASDSLLRAMEREIMAAGHQRSILESTVTALHFYTARGYLPDGPVGEKFGLITHPLIKRLAP